MSKKESLWNYTSEAKKPWFHFGYSGADDKFTGIMMYLFGLATCLLPIYAIIVGEWRWFWVSIVLAILNGLLAKSQDQDAPWMATDDDPFVCPHCNEGFTRKDMRRNGH